VLAIGGFGGAGGDPGALPPLVAHAAALSGQPSPRVCVLNTASGDDAAAYTRTYQLLWPLRGHLTHLALFPMPNVADPEDLLLSQDVIFVGGGSVANMVAVWQVHGLDRILRQAWQAGIVLAGVSAGAICWFDGGTTDSFGADLRPFTAGLRLLPGSYCPHYSSEPLRRSCYQGLVAYGTLGGGIACDDGAAAHFADDDLAEILTDHPGACGYRVAADGSGGATETPLATRLLTIALPARKAANCPT
jgi:peptidase E